MRKICLSLFVFSYFFLQSCYEPVEDCLDFEASNLQLNTDRDCSSCCRYPAINIGFELTFDTFNLQSGSNYTNNVGATFTLLDHYFAVSDFELQTEAGTAVAISDSIVLQYFAASMLDSVSRPNDVDLIRLGTPSIRLDTFRFSGIFNEIDFRLGYPDQFTQIDINSIDDDFARAFQRIDDRRDANGNYIFLYFKMINTLQDTLELMITDESKVKNFALDGNIFKEMGENLAVSIEVDYQEWTKNINFDTMTKSEINAVMEQNILSVFKLLE